MTALSHFDKGRPGAGPLKFMSRLAWELPRRAVVSTVVRAYLLLGVLLTSCTQVTSAPVRAPAPAPQVEDTWTGPAPRDPQTERDPLARAHAIVQAEVPDRGWLSRDDQAALAAEGLDAALAMDALADAAARCNAEGRCTKAAPDEHTVKVLIRIAGDSGTAQVLPALMRLDARGYLASIAIETILEREMVRELGPCAPPSAAEVAAAREQLGDFEIVDRDGKRFVTRTPTASELDELAYFYAGVADSDPMVGEAARSGVPKATPDPVDVELRQRNLAALDEALATGALDDARDAATSYLTSLGYPGPIDASREAEYAWGGARFSYVMRDLALLSEVTGEYAVAADLYVRANPGGGSCGTSVDARRGNQLQGLVRVQERAGNCRAVVAHRLLDWDGDYDPGDEANADFVPGYGPGRLAAQGWDLARMYRGALLTRNRTDAEGQLGTRLERAGSTAAARRAAREGDEHWDLRVRAVEGLADIGGKPVIDELTDLLPVTDDTTRERILAAIGELTVRRWAGPCPNDGTWWLGDLSSNVWSRRVSRIGTQCDLQLSDADAASVASVVMPFAKDRNGSAQVRHAAMRTIGQLAVPSHRTLITRWYRTARKREERSCAGVQESTWDEACQAARTEHWVADDVYERWIVAVDHVEDFEHDADDPLD